MSQVNQSSPPRVRVLEVAPGPHIASRTLTTRKMMLDVLIGLVPVIAVSIWVFQLYAVRQLVFCVAATVLAEAAFTAMRKKPILVGDLSAVVTGVILALSLPGSAPWYVGMIGGVVAVGIGKVVFGGLGQNIFNPAMVGRAFVMIAFANLLGAGGYVVKEVPKDLETKQPIYHPGLIGQIVGIPYTDVQKNIPDAMTHATPMADWKENVNKPDFKPTPLWNLFLGNTNGSLGETSALACLLGGLYLCLRRTASWEIPLGVILGVSAWAGIQNAMNPSAAWGVLHHLLGGAVLFGAFFIATDPVSSPLTPKGKFVFGLAMGLVIMLFRTFSAYPEGVMFSVLLMNAMVPLINRWTIPKPVGGPVPTMTK